MKVWAVANQKGGVGKTTTAVTLAGVFASRGYRTLLIDLDPHGSLTAYFGMDPDRVEQSVYRLFSDTMVDPERLISDTRFENLFLLPASTAMATLDRQLGAQTGKGLVIVNALNKLAEHFDHVLIDCAPSLGILLVNALAACSHLIIPVQTEFLALKGLERMLHTLSMVQRSARRELPYTIVPTMFDRRTRAGTLSLDQLRESHSARLWSSVIPVDTQFREASRAGIPLSLRSATDRGSVAYTELADFLLHDDSYAPPSSQESEIVHSSRLAH